MKPAASVISRPFVHDPHALPEEPVTDSLLERVRDVHWIAGRVELRPAPDRSRIFVPTPAARPPGCRGSVADQNARAEVEARSVLRAEKHARQGLFDLATLFVDARPWTG